MQQENDFDWREESYDNCVQRLLYSTNDQYPVTMAALSLREDVISAALSMPHLNPGYDNQDALLSLICSEHKTMDCDFAMRAIDQLLTHPLVMITQNVLFEMVRTYHLIDDKEVFWHAMNLPNRNFFLGMNWLHNFVIDTIPEIGADDTGEIQQCLLAKFFEVVPTPTTFTPMVPAAA